MSGVVVGHVAQVSGDEERGEEEEGNSEER